LLFDKKPQGFTHKRLDLEKPCQILREVITINNAGSLLLISTALGKSRRDKGTPNASAGRIDHNDRATLAASQSPLKQNESP
jgi:hypothetical protein